MLGTVGSQHAAAIGPALDGGQKADRRAAQLLPAGIDQHNIVRQQHRAAAQIAGRIVAQPHPQLAQGLVLMYGQRAVERVAIVELKLGMGVVRVDIGQPQPRQSAQRQVSVAAGHVRGIGAIARKGSRPSGIGRIAVGIAGARQEQGQRVLCSSNIEPQSIVARLVEGQRGEAGVNGVAYHQPIGGLAPLVAGDDQVVEERPVGIGREIGAEGQRLRGIAHPARRLLDDLAALRLRLRLGPGVDLPAAADGTAEDVVEVVAFEQLADVAGIRLAGVGGDRLVPRPPVRLL